MGTLASIIGLATAKIPATNLGFGEPASQRETSG